MPLESAEIVGVEAEAFGGLDSLDQTFPGTEMPLTELGLEKIRLASRVSDDANVRNDVHGQIANLLERGPGLEQVLLAQNEDFIAIEAAVQEFPEPIDIALGRIFRVQGAAEIDRHCSVARPSREGFPTVQELDLYC